MSDIRDEIEEEVGSEELAEKIEELVEKKVQERLDQQKEEQKKESEQDVGRRKFLKKMGVGALGLGAAALIPSAGALDVRDSQGLNVYDSGSKYLDVSSTGVNVQNTDLLERGNRIATRTWVNNNADVPSADWADTAGGVQQLSNGGGIRTGVTSAGRFWMAPYDGSSSELYNKEFTFDPSVGQWNIEGTPQAGGQTIATRTWVNNNTTGFSGSHKDLTDVSSADHHTRYTDSEALSAVQSTNLDFGTNYLTFTGMEGSGNEYYLGDSNVPDANETSGIKIETQTNPGDGNPIFTVESSGGVERLRVEHGGATDTVGNDLYERGNRVATRNWVNNQYNKKLFYRQVHSFF